MNHPFDIMQRAYNQYVSAQVEHATVNDPPPPEPPSIPDRVASRYEYDELVIKVREYQAVKTERDARLKDAEEILKQSHKQLCDAIPEYNRWFLIDPKVAIGKYMDSWGGSHPVVKIQILKDPKDFYELPPIRNPYRD